MIDVLLVRGAPGVGKSTLGRGLRGVLEHGAVVEVDQLRGMQSPIDWCDPGQHAVALAVSLAAAREFVARGLRPVVLVDTFFGGSLGRAQTALDEFGIRHASVSLWIEPDELRARLEARERGWKDWPSTRGVNEEIRETRYPSEMLVDVTGLESEEVLGLIAGLVKARSAGCASDHVPQRPPR